MFSLKSHLSFQSNSQAHPDIHLTSLFPFPFPAANGHLECVQTMLRYLRSSHIDCIDSLGRTPLMMAVQNGHSEIVGLLIDQGARVELGDRHLRTALHRAVRSCAIYRHAIYSSKDL